ncbi:hypothetical protein NONI108955_10975 [Nocardia ninae]|uniref:Uncharacterized protein n=1 Tax=Nocardia ninae NBRC 108245 TaxID=1210091 RepID=A0A511MPU8_9NOCA|nr:hypothetical protein [Nocardia ninae]GEM41976.1 hypothetical protein NN4_64950 [Nocardia ninae NBRC 108245]
MSVRVFTEEAGNFDFPTGESVRTEPEFNNLEVVDSDGRIVGVYARWVGAWIEHDSGG